MGTYIHLAVGRLQLDWGKNDGYLDHAGLFQPGDIAQIPYYYVYESKGSYLDDDGRTRYHLHAEWQDGMSKPLGLVADRLRLLGFSLKACESEFEHLYGSEPEGFSFEDLKRVFIEIDVRTISYEGGMEEQFGRFMRAHLIERYLHHGAGVASRLGFGDEDVYETFGSYMILLLLSLNPGAQDLPVNWQFADSEQAGWIDRKDIQRRVGASQRFLIVTEGSSDAHIIKQALKLLKPHIADFFDFVDMEEGYPFSGTGNLLKFLKGLISISVQNNVVVVYDNDAEGVTNYEKSCALNVPENMAIMKLPDRTEFERFSTIGPNGKHEADINGCAAAIECYLDLGSESLVRWTSFNERIDRYQGELIGKTNYAKDFLAQRARKADYDYRGIAAVVDAVIENCISIQSKTINKMLENLDRTAD